MINPNRKLTELEITRFCNESRFKLSFIATIDYDFEPMMALYESALNEARDLQQAYLAGYVHEPDFMGIQIPLVWDVASLLKANNPVTSKEVPVRYLRGLMSPEIFDDPHGSSFSHGAIILAELPFCRPNACILDGNHRVLDAIRSGKTVLSTKLYYAQDHIKFMY